MFLKFAILKRNLEIFLSHRKFTNKQAEIENITLTRNPDSLIWIHSIQTSLAPKITRIFTITEDKREKNSDSKEPKDEDCNQDLK